MKKMLMSAGAIAAVMIALPASTSAHAYMADTHQGHGSYQRCEKIAGKLTSLNAASGEATDRQLWRAQHLIDRSSGLDCAQPATVVDALVKNGNFKTLTAAVTAAGLGEALSAPGDKTVFAPTDAAFAALPAGTVEALLQDIPTLKTILTNHVVSGKADAVTALNAGSAQSLAGNTLQVTEKGGFLYVNGVKVILNDIYTGNGVVHVIDAVLVP
jgi:uncharacterized surface protein with fasciclin (FAS1) repeats